MRVQSVSVTGVAASAPLALDNYSVGGADTVFIDIGAGCTASVQVTPDDIFDPNVVPVWYAAAAGVTGVTTDTAAQLNLQARAIRLNQTVGANTSVLKLVSHGII